MVDADLIKAAVELLDPANNDHWEADGSPNLAKLREDLKQPDLSFDDVEDAVPPEMLKRPRKVAAKTKAKGAAGPTATDDKEVTSSPPALAGETGDAPDPAEVSEPVDPLDPATAEAQLKDAREKHAVIHEQITDKERERDAAQNAIDDLKLKLDEQIVRIETHAPRVNQAQAVKAIQRQTQERLLKQKGAQLAATVALAASGVNQVFASKLDATLAARKKSPQEQANYAAYVHQNSQRRAEGVA